MIFKVDKYQIIKMMRVRKQKISARAIQKFNISGFGASVGPISCFRRTRVGVWPQRMLSIILVADGKVSLSGGVIKKSGNGDVSGFFIWR